jgi:hypothetical protein
MLDLIPIVTVSTIKNWNLKTGSGKAPDEVSHDSNDCRRREEEEEEEEGEEEEEEEKRRR